MSFEATVQEVTDQAKAVVTLYGRLKTEDVTDELADALRIFSWGALMEKNAQACVDTGVIPCLITLSEKYVLQLVGVRAAVCAVNLAIHPVTHPALLAAGALEAALRLLKYLDGTTDDEIDTGLTACFLICRTVGKQ